MKYLSAVLMLLLVSGALLVSAAEAGNGRCDASARGRHERRCAMAVTYETIELHIADNADNGYWRGASFDNSGGLAYAGVYNDAAIMTAFAKVTNANIPAGAVIANAQFLVEITGGNGTPLIKVQGEAATNPTAVTSAADGNARVRTTASVAWDGMYGSSPCPNLAAIIQELVNRAAYIPGQAMQFFFTDNGGGAGDYLNFFTRSDHAGDQIPPVLKVTYSVDTAARAVALGHATAFVHEGSWPFQRIAELVSAHDISRSFELMAPGQASLSIADNDPAVTNDIVRRGNLLVIVSPIAPPWAGPISLLSDTLEDGVINIEAQGWAAVLSIRITPINELWLEGSSGAAFRSILGGINSRGHTGLFAGLSPEPGPAIRDLQLGGQDAMSALGDLHTRTGYEWWLTLDVSRARAVASMYWGARAGFDKSNQIVLRDGIHFVKRSYALDVSKLRQSVTVVGGTGPISGRAAVTRGVASPGSATLGTAFEALDQALSESLDVPPMLRSESILYQRGASDRGTLSKQAQQSLEETAGGAEKIAGSINEAIVWSSLGIGDYVSVITDTSGLGSVTRRARIVAMQPDEELGECEIALEVPVR